VAFPILATPFVGYLLGGSLFNLVLSVRVTIGRGDVSPAGLTVQSRALPMHVTEDSRPILTFRVIAALGAHDSVKAVKVDQRIASVSVGGQRVADGAKRYGEAATVGANAEAMAESGEGHRSPNRSMQTIWTDSA
jgi:hypothetical protein